MDSLQDEIIEGAVWLRFVLAALRLALTVLTPAQTVTGAEVVVALSREITGQ